MKKWQSFGLMVVSLKKGNEVWENSGLKTVSFLFVLSIILLEMMHQLFVVGSEYKA
ncbi:MAG: hypothetical protein QS721_09175 [Candidatus Endonucleobacter sp. (ex Gigantidas childressi)]|nr:hypothetical protein [Candidatus Endonucleobacter sp. (ex Gigantidas childressi)]